MGMLGLELTLVTEWDLACDRVFLLPIIQGSYFGGVILVRKLSFICPNDICLTVLVFNKKSMSPKYLFCFVLKM
jgi:hypothetical protein